MPEEREGRIVRRKAGETPPMSPERIAQMLAIRDEDIDFSDIPERTYARRLYRDSDGRLPRRHSPIRESVAAAMAERGMTAHTLWQAAKAHSPTITEAVIDEFVKGQRSLGIEYLEAILEALGLEVGKKAGGPA